MAQIRQTFKNHARLRPLYHYFMAPLGLGLTVWSGVMLYENTVPEQGFLFLLAVATLFALYTPRVYALENQDRIIRLEMRYRYHLLTGKRLEPLEQPLGLRRIIALRFAADAELPSLLEQTLKENLSAKEIKERISDWQGDYHRV